MNRIKPVIGRLALLLGLILLCTIGWSARGSSMVFGGGPFYSGGQAVMNVLRASGYTTVMLWCIHVDATTGNLIYNDQLVVSNGVYVGNAAWPGQLATLKTAPTSVNRIEVSVGSWGVNDFQSIQTLITNHGTNATSILYRNFQALKKATGADAIDYDDETLYSTSTDVQFGQMLAAIGCQVTFCPYTDASFWQGVYHQLGTNIVKAVYLQCYSGGTGNDPGAWNSYFPGLKVQPGLWCMNGNNCASGTSSAQVGAQMAAWKSADGITGGFMWLYDDMQACSNGGQASDYAHAINQAVDPLQISPASGFAGVAAYNAQIIPAHTTFMISNNGTAPLNWSLINTCLWLSATGSGTLAAGGSATVTVDLNAAIGTNLPAGFYSASVLFSNRTSGIVLPANFTLDTAILNWPVAVTGFNASILAASTATASNPGASAFDVPNGYCFYESGLSGSSRGLPVSGAFPSAADALTAFQLGPYGSADALMLGYNHPKSGTLGLTTPQAFAVLNILAASANGGGQGAMVVNFTDGTHSPVFAYNAQDWFYTITNVALQGFGRLQLGASLVAQDNGSANPNFYQTTINLAAVGLTQAVSSITFSNPAAAGAQETTAILAVSGMATTVPVPPPNGLTAIPGTNGTVQLGWNAAFGAASYNVKYSLASNSGYGLAGNSASNGFTANNLVNGTTYYFKVSSVGTVNESSNSSPVSANPGSYLAWVMAGNPVAYWPLNEMSGAVVHDLVAGSNGLSTGAYTPNYPGRIGAGFGSPHRATHYDGSTGCTQLPALAGGTNITIVFWVLAQGSGGSPNWYNGRGLVDGYVAAGANDFGVALVGGKVGFGVGNPDTTLLSVNPINNGLWHQVAVTRNSGTGLMSIYIDGTLDSSMTGPIGARMAAPNWRIASLQTGAAGGFLSGTASDVAVYNQQLAAGQIADLYSAATGRYYNVTLTGTWSGGALVLSWPGNGKLQEATSPAGPWVTDSTDSPHTVVPAGPAVFYRVQTQ